MSATTPQTDDSRLDVVERVTKLPASDLRELCRDNFGLFADVVTYNWLQESPTQWEEIPDHFLHWNEMVESSPLNIILAGRKHTKTTFVCCKIMHQSEFVDGHASLYWANTENQVEDRMTELEEMIDTNPWLENLHSDGALKSKTFSNGSKLHTTWVTGAVEGGHVNLSIGDDPLKEFGDIPDERIEEWYGKVIVPMLNRDGLHVIVGTRKRPSDLYEILRTKNADSDWGLPSYNLVEYPAIREVWLGKYGDDRPDNLASADLYTEVNAPQLAAALDVPGKTVSVLWPEGRPAQWLAGRLGAQGKPYFIREFCMVFSQAADAIITRDDIDDHCSLHDSAPDFVDVGTADCPYTRTAIGVDPASTQGTDHSSFVTLGVRDSGVRDILSVFNAEAINPARFKAKLQELDRRYAPSAIVIESNGMQQYIIDDAVEFDRSLPIKRHHTSQQKHSWKTGIPRIAHRIGQGGYQFYREADDNTEELIDALTSLVMKDGKLQGHTPDPVSALYQAEQAIGSKIPTASISLDDNRDDLDDEDKEFEDSEIGRALQDINRGRREGPL
jgi:hypothetical protein